MSDEEQGTTPCTRCSTPVPATFRFCPECGSAMASDAPVEVDSSFASRPTDTLPVPRLRLVSSVPSVPVSTPAPAQPESPTLVGPPPGLGAPEADEPELEAPADVAPADVASVEEAPVEPTLEQPAAPVAPTEPPAPLVPWTPPNRTTDVRRAPHHTAVIKPIQGPERGPRPAYVPPAPQRSVLVDPVIKPILGPEREPAPARPPYVAPPTPSWATGAPAAPTRTTAAATARPRSGQRTIAEPESRPWIKVVAAAVAVLLIAGGFGWYFQRSLDNPVREAFDRSHGEFVNATRQLDDATTLEQVAAAGASYSRALPLLTTASSEAQGRDSEVGLAARRTVDQQIAVAEAGSLLAEISERNIAPWTEAREPLRASVAALAQRRGDVERLGQDPSTLPASAVVTGVEEVVGQAATTSVDKTLKRLFGKLARAERTSQLRSVGASAQETITVIETVTAPASSAAQPGPQLATYLPVLEQLAGLSAIDGKTLGQWAALRSALATSVQGLPAESLTAVRAQAALAAVDTLIAGAMDAISAWQAQYDAVKTQRTASGSGLDAYRDAMRTQQERYSGLRRELSSWTTVVGSQKVTSDEAIAALSQAAGQRAEVRDAMAALTVPSPMADAHAALVGVVDSAAEAVSDALVALQNDQQCKQACNYGNTEGWQELSDASTGITSSYDAALSAWQQAVTATRKSGKSLVLPPRPKV